MTKDKIHKLLHSTETSRIERSVSTGDIDKFQEAICAFSNLNDKKLYFCMTETNRIEYKREFD